MVDPDILAKYGCTRERLKAVFTAQQPGDMLDRSEEEKAAIKKDIETREKIQRIIDDRQMESITRNLQNHLMYSSVDLAWDGTPINKAAVPLMLYAQGKLNFGQCADTLACSGFGKYVTKDERGKPISFDVPKFYEVQVNLIRSILTRRLAAQSNKYANLWPYYKYESRSTSLVAKLRADVLSQRVDIMCDQFDAKHHEVQVQREVLLYGHVVDFIRCAWEKEQQERKLPQAPGLETKDFKTEVVTVKEGVAFVNPHPSRVFWDNAHPLISLNSDTGCEWVGFWDVQRYKDINNNTQYWNRESLNFSSNVVTLFSTFSSYFTQYYCTITPPSLNGMASDLTSLNDRQNNIGMYSAQRADTSVITANHYWKIVPKDWNLGEYMHPVWLRLVVGGLNTVMFAEWLPSSPCAVESYNENDNRQVNLSFAHELMGYQDQLTNLLSYLLLCLQADHIKVVIIDTDLSTAEHIKAFREQLKGTNAYTGTSVLEISRSKMNELGIVKPEDVIKLVETKDSQIDVIFRAIGQLLQMVERMAALSPQEQGQPAPREISATETNLIAGTTESVYGFISDAHDEYRAAKKRIIYESLMAMGDSEFTVPVVNRYPSKVIEAAGFKVGENEDFTVETISPGAPERPQRYTVIGTKDKLEHDYIFTSRDGAERPVNTQSAAVLVQLLQTVMSIPGVAGKIKLEQLYEMVNEVFRQSGAGYDLKLELQPGEDNMIGPDPNEIIKQIQSVLEGLTEGVENNTQKIDAITAAIEPMLKAMPPAVQMESVAQAAPQMMQPPMAA